jgi:hypothetical protein
VLCAMCAAVHGTTRFDAVPDDPALAMSAFRSQCMDGAFEGIEIMRNPVLHNFERLVVFIAADFARSKPLMQTVRSLASFPLTWCFVP